MSKKNRIKAKNKANVNNQEQGGKCAVCGCELAYSLGTESYDLGCCVMKFKCCNCGAPSYVVATLNGFGMETSEMIWGEDNLKAWLRSYDARPATKVPGAVLEVGIMTDDFFLVDSPLDMTIGKVA